MALRLARAPSLIATTATMNPTPKALDRDPSTLTWTLSKASTRMIVMRPALPVTTSGFLTSSPAALGPALESVHGHLLIVTAESISSSLLRTQYILMIRADLRAETQQCQSDSLALLTSIVSLRVESV